MLGVIHDGVEPPHPLKCWSAVHLEQIFCKLPTGLRCLETLFKRALCIPFKVGVLMMNYQLAKEISRTMLGGISRTNRWVACTVIDERTWNKFLQAAHQQLSLHAWPPH